MRCQEGGVFQPLSVALSFTHEGTPSSTLTPTVASPSPPLVAMVTQSMISLSRGVWPTLSSTLSTPDPESLLQQAHREETNSKVYEVLMSYNYKSNNYVILVIAGAHEGKEILTDPALHMSTFISST